MAPGHDPLGTQWAPAAAFKKSLGLIAMISNEPMKGGADSKPLTRNRVRQEQGGGDRSRPATAEIKRLRRGEPATPADFT